MKLFTWNNLSEKERGLALERPSGGATGVATMETASAIVDRVRSSGDAAVKELTRQFDGADIDNFRLTDEEIESACEAVPQNVKSAVEDAIERIRVFHEACRPERRSVETAPGVICERRPVPIQTVGLYVPSGRTPLPSTAIMLGVPSSIAGCPNRVLCVPPRANGSVDPTVVFAARQCGISNLFRIGGAQAIAAMAYGTATVPRCDKIFGPGNAFVTAAKLLVSQDPAGAAIDMPAGPSEVLVLVDEHAQADFVAADLLAQCEHGSDSHAVLVTTSKRIAEAVLHSLEDQLANIPTAGVAREALSSGAVICVDSVDTAISVTNRYAPEHLIIQTNQPVAVAEEITTAGSVFIGPWTPETLGDYCSGTNHVLPTNGFARSSSGLSVDSFSRYMTLQTATIRGLHQLSETALTLAGAEGLAAHANAVQLRLDAAQTEQGNAMKAPARGDALQFN